MDKDTSALGDTGWLGSSCFYSLHEKVAQVCPPSGPTPSSWLGDLRNPSPWWWHTGTSLLRLLGWHLCERHLCATRHTHPNPPKFLFGNKLLKKHCSTNIVKYTLIHIPSRQVGFLPNQTLRRALPYFFQSEKYTKSLISSHCPLDLKTLAIIQDLNDCLLGKSIFSSGNGRSERYNDT